MAYESRQAILEEAGLSQVVTAETPSGLVNGTNTVFTVNHIPLTDMNYDDVIDVNDVLVFVNSTIVSVSSINVDTGQVTLTAAPATGTAVTITYRYSSVTDGRVQQVQEEAANLVDDRLLNIDHPATSATIRKIVRYYAAGMLLARDYGFQNDTQQTSKDGYKKMEMAEAWLESYATLLYKQEEFAEGGDEDLLTAEVKSDADLFTTWNSTTGLYVSRDDTFMRNLEL